MEIPVFQGFALRWGNGWAFGPNTFQLSCKHRCTCPSCHQERALLNAIHVAEEVCYMRTWPHSGFSVDQSVFLPAGDLAGIQRLMQYMTPCPLSLSRLIKVTKSGQIVFLIGLWLPVLSPFSIFPFISLWQHLAKLFK